MSEETVPGTTSLTIRETELGIIALQALKSKVDLDIDKFATMAGYSSIASAQVCFANLKRKLNAATTTTYYVAAGSPASSGPTPKSTPKKPRTKAGAKAAARGKAVTPAEDSPTKRKGSPTEDATPTKRVKKEDIVKKEEDADEESPAAAPKNDED
ncbi:MAG: hypothetical protein Q9169_003686 [Polycauliona sp. 2 TL-2023]